MGRGCPGPSSPRRGAFPAGAAPGRALPAAGEPPAVSGSGRGWSRSPCPQRDPLPVFGMGLAVPVAREGASSPGPRGARSPRGRSRSVPVARGRSRSLCPRSRSRRQQLPAEPCPGLSQRRCPSSPLGSRPSVFPAGKIPGAARAAEVKPSRTRPGSAVPAPGAAASLFPGQGFFCSLQRPGVPLMGSAVIN